MNILLVANYELDRQESMQRFAAALEAGLVERGQVVRVVKPGVVLGRLVGDRSRLRKWLGYIDKLILFPRKLSRLAEWADVVHICDHSNAPYTTSVRGRPVVVTCHDLLAIRSALDELEENPTGWTGRFYQRLIRVGLRKSPVIICVSESTRADVARLVHGRQQTLCVVHNGLNYPYSPMSREDSERHIRLLGLASGKYLLHVGGNHWYKNRMGVLRIFRELIRRPDMRDLNLILAGEPCAAEMSVYIADNELGARVMVLSGITNEQLRALYSAAAGLLFPSLHEGFGWPIIEAHACGCPVFTTNRPPMTEVGGVSAIYIDPENSVDAAVRIAAALDAKEGGGDLALKNAARFTHSRMIEEYISVYQRVTDELGSSKK